MSTQMPGSPQFDQFDQEAILDMAVVGELQALDQGSGFFAELVSEIGLQNDQLLHNIHRDMLDYDYVQLHFSFHTIKGSSLNIGARRQGMLALFLEEASKREDCATVNEYVPLLTAVTEETMDALRSLL